MALPDLATTTDLQARGIDITDTALIAAMLAAASASVRNAAGSPILQATSTVALTAWGEMLLDLPGQPIQSVASVTLDGTAVTDYKLANGRLWRRRGWGNEFEPFEVVVTMTHGLPDVPADIVDLVCNLTSAAASAATAGETFDPRVFMERIDDYTIQYQQGEQAVASILDLPAAARRHLRARFGGGAGVVEYR